MAKTMSVTRNQNIDDDASSGMRLRTFEKGGVAPWSDIDHDVLFVVMMKLGAVDFVAFSGVCKSWRSFALSNRHRFMTRNQNNDASSMKRIQSYVVPWTSDVLSLVMMRLGVVDFVAFSEVCKSWRSLALSNRKRFMATRPPMLMRIFSGTYENECYGLMDFEGRKFNMHLPHLVGRTCVGSTCGYLILIGKKTNDFWLVNPITRHQLHFPNCPCLENVYQTKAILVFSPSIPGWVLVVINRSTDKIWFSTAGTGAWNHVLSDSPINDILAFKGKIYTIHKGLSLCELRLDSKPKLTILIETTSFRYWCLFIPEFVSSGENLYVKDSTVRDPHNIFELDFGEMKWLLLDEQTTGKYAFFFSFLEHGVAIKLESWAVDPLSQYMRYDCFHKKTADKCPKGRFFFTSGWYFPHLCLDVDILHE